MKITIPMDTQNRVLAGAHDRALADTALAVKALGDQMATSVVSADDTVIDRNLGKGRIEVDEKTIKGLRLQASGTAKGRVDGTLTDLEGDQSVHVKVSRYGETRIYKVQSSDGDLTVRWDPKRHRITVLSDGEPGALPSWANPSALGWSDAQKARNTITWAQRVAAPIKTAATTLAQGTRQAATAIAGSPLTDAALTAGAAFVKSPEGQRVVGELETAAIPVARTALTALKVPAGVIEPLAKVVTADAVRRSGKPKEE